MKDQKVEEPKSRPQKSKVLAPQRFDSAETFVQAWKEKKKKDGRYCKRKPQSSTSVTRVNSTNTSRDYLSGSGRFQP